MSRGSGVFCTRAVGLSLCTCSDCSAAMAFPPGTDGSPAWDPGRHKRPRVGEFTPLFSTLFTTVFSTDSSAAFSSTVFSACRVRGGRDILALPSRPSERLEGQSRLSGPCIRSSRNFSFDRKGRTLRSLWGLCGISTRRPYRSLAPVLRSGQYVLLGPPIDPLV